MSIHRNHCRVRLHRIVTALLMLAAAAAGPVLGQDDQGDNFVPHSAAELGVNVGLEYLQPLVVGNADQVKAGVLPLAGTLPITFGKIKPEGIKPDWPPPAQRKITGEYEKGFDVDNLYQTKDYQPYKSDLYDRLFVQSADSLTARYPVNLVKAGNIEYNTDDNAQKKGLREPRKTNPRPPKVQNSPRPKPVHEKPPPKVRNRF